MNASYLLGLTPGIVFIAVLLTWPFLPGLRRMRPFKTFPPFKDWTARPHPDALVPVKAGARLGGGSADQEAANATVVVRTAWGRYHSRGTRLETRFAPPLVPVVSVDGVPASWGWGTTRLTLPPGEHLIAVAGGHSRHYRQVNLKRGERIDLDYVDVLTARSARFAEAGELHDRTSFRERRRGPAGVGLFYLFTLVGFAIAAALTGLVLLGGGERLLVASDGIVYGAFGIGLVVAIVAIVRALRRRKGPERTAEPPGPGEAPIVLDADRPERMTPASGWSALALHLRFEFETHSQEDLEALASGPPSLWQRLRTAQIGEPEAPVSRPWVPAPEVTVDGEAVPASWTRMWLQLPPGEHEIAVRVPPSPQADDGTAVDLSRGEVRQRVTLESERTEQLAYVARVAAVGRRDRPGLAVFRAALR